MSDYFTDSTPCHHDILFIITDGIYENSAFRLAQTKSISPVVWRTQWQLSELEHTLKHSMISLFKIKLKEFFCSYISLIRKPHIQAEIPNHAEKGFISVRLLNNKYLLNV
jgi:hypothetical protein